MAINIPFFTPPLKDQSVYYLGQIFGTMGSILTPDPAPLILGEMFKTLNTIILTIGVMIVLYITIVGVIKTAHEGEPLGKQWSTLWLPIRMVMGIASLVPSTSGYSFLQILIMWVIIQGIGAADSIWTTTLQYYSAFGSLTAKVTTASGLQASSAMQTLFQMMVCQASADYPSSYTAAQGKGPYCSGNLRDCSRTQSSAGNITTIKFALNGACGKMTVCYPTSFCADTSGAGQIACAACTAQNDAIGKIMGNQTVNATINGQSKSFVGFGKVAEQFVLADYDYRVFFDNLLDPAKTRPGVVDNYCNGPGGIPDVNQCCGKPSLESVLSLSSDVKACELPNRGLLSSDDSLPSGGFDGPPQSTVTMVYWPYLLKEIPDLSPSFIQDAADYYTSAITTAVDDKVQQLIAGASTKSSSTIDETEKQKAIDAGWIYAGAFYYTLSNYNNKNQYSATPNLTVMGNDPATALSTSKNPLYGYRNNYTAAGYLVDYVTQLAQQAQPGSTGGATTGYSFSSTSLPSSVSGLGKITDGFNSLASWAMNTFQKMFTGSSGEATNPLVSLQSFGQGMLIALQIIFAVILVVMVAAGLIGFAGGSALGTTIENPIGPTLTLLSIIFTPLFSVLLGGLFMFAAMLAIYTPLIPYIIFTVGVLAWFILVIEAIIAGPLVALGLLMPGGQSELWGKSEQALMLLFSIFLRPGLMIFGMVAAMLLSIVAVSVVNYAFVTVAGAAMSNPGPIELLLFIAAYATLILSVLNKSFALIHIVPDQLLRWIGHHPGQEGSPEQALGQVKGGVESGAGAAKGAGGGALGSADTKGTQARKEYEEELTKKQNKAKGPPGSASDADKK